MNLHKSRYINGLQFVTNYGTGRVLAFNPNLFDDMGEIVYYGNYEQCVNYINGIDRTEADLSGYEGI